MKTGARKAALLALTSVRKNKAWSDIAVRNEIRKAGLDRRDGALTAQLVYGVLQNMYLCDFYISQYSSIKTNKIAPAVLDILRIGVYQIVFLDKIPQSAAVNECVSMAKAAVGSKTAGFVNAVLRKIAQNVNSLPAVYEDDDVQYLSIKYSHPRWIIDRLITQFGRRSAEEILKENNLNPGTVCRVNTIKATARDVQDALLSHGIDASPHKNIDNCIVFSGAGDIESLDIYKNGWIYAQDSASQYAVMALSPKPGEFVADVCAAPGGKSFLAAQYMQCKGEILACDIYENKLNDIAKTAQRLGIGIIKTQKIDTSVGDRKLSGAADKVICDVPCSGMGIIRKKPDIRYKKEDDIKDLPVLQLAILKNASGYLKRGGEMIYSTCTVFKEENEDVVSKFISENDEYELCGFSLPGIGNVARGMITLLPNIHGTDGFFISKIRRK